MTEIDDAVFNHCLHMVINMLNNNFNRYIIITRLQYSFHLHHFTISANIHAVCLLNPPNKSF